MGAQDISLTSTEVAGNLRDTGSVINRSDQIHSLLEGLTEEEFMARAREAKALDVYAAVIGEQSGTLTDSECSCFSGNTLSEIIDGQNDGNTLSCSSDGYLTLRVDYAVLEGDTVGRTYFVGVQEDSCGGGTFFEGSATSYLQIIPSSQAEACRADLSLARSIIESGSD